MKFATLIIFVSIFYFAFVSCDKQVADPIVPEPMDNLNQDPIDSLNKKWAGDYYGTVYRSSWNPSGHTADTLYNSKVTLSEFVRSTIYDPRIYVKLIFNDQYIDSSYHTGEQVYVYDSIKIYHYQTGFSDILAYIILNKNDNSLTHHYSYANIGSGSNINAYYVKK